MNRKSSFVATAILTLTVMSVLPGLPGFIAATGSPSTDSLIVLFKSSTLPSNYASVIQSAGGEVTRAVSEIGVAAARAVSTTTDDFQSRLLANAAIAGVGPDMNMDLIMPSALSEDSVDSSYVAPDTHTPHPFPFAPLPADFFYYTPQQWSIHRVKASPAEAWSVTTGSPSITIAILDTGVSSVHPDTAPNLVGAVSFVAPTPCDDGSPEDQFGHGTWTAALAAGAMGPGTGLTIGVAPTVSILNVKVLARVPDFTFAPPLFNQCLNGGGSGTFGGVLSGIVYAASAGAKVISLSLGGYVDISGASGAALWTAMLRATNFVFDHNAVIIASAGNGALDLDNIGPFRHLPSDLPNVIAVTATDNPTFNLIGPGDHLASYSNYGSSLHGLAAPGGDLPAGGAPGPTGFVRGACSPGVPGTVTGLPGPGTSFGCFSFGTNHRWYVQAIGTSASAPHVAGVAALILSVKPNLRPNQVRSILYQTAEDIGMVGYDEFFNFGLVDAYAAVLGAQNYNPGGGAGSARSR